MSRKTKNILMISIMIIVIVLSVLTIIDAVKSANNFGAMKDMFQNGQITKPNGDMNSGTRPEKPSNGNTDDGEKQSMPSRGERPSGISGNSSKPQFERPTDDGKVNSESFQNGQIEITEKRNIVPSSVSTSYYILFFLEAIIFSTLLVYLVLSQLNKKTVLETFSSTKQLLVYILIALVLTVGLTFLQSFISKGINNNQTAKFEQNVNAPSRNVTSEEETNI